MRVQKTGMGEELRVGVMHTHKIILAQTEEVYLVGVVAGRRACSDVAPGTCRQPSGLASAPPSPTRQGGLGGSLG